LTVNHPRPKRRGIQHEVGVHPIAASFGEFDPQRLISTIMPNSNIERSGKMRRYISIVLAGCLLIVAPLSVAFSMKILFDDFATGHLDKTKWWPREYTREIKDGKLVFKLGNSNGMGAEIEPGLFDVDLQFVDPSTIEEFEGEVTIIETRYDSLGSYSAARIGGYFYNSNDTGGATGDIFAHMRIGDFGNGGLEAEWTAYRVISDDGELEFIQGNKLFLPGGIQYNQPLNVKVSYDGDKTISFLVNGQTDSFTGPDRKRYSVTLNKGFSATILTENSNEYGFIYVNLDNVYINNRPVVYDDFSSQLIDTSKWKQTEWVRECSNGYLRANIRGGGSTQTANTYLSEKDASYVEAKVRIDSSSLLSTGAAGIGRIQGYYYNDSRGPGSGQAYNKYEGDVLAQVRLRYDSNGSLSAGAYVDRSNDADEASFTNLFSHTFSVPIALDSNYILSIGFYENILIFACEGETAEFQIATPVYTPYGEHRLLRSRIQLDPGETGYMKAIFDDVYITPKGSCIGDYEPDGDVDGSDVYRFIVGDLEISINEFALGFGKTNCSMTLQ
jgi:hypothetical protein